MIRIIAWSASLAVGFACHALVVEAQTATQPASATATTQSAPAGWPADYVVDIPAEDDASTQAQDGAPHSGALEEQFARDGFTPGPGKDIADANAATPQTEVIKERFPSGLVKIERQVTQDGQGNYLNHGPWKMWDERGNLIAQGEYDLGERNGEWIRWYRAAAESELFSKLPYSQFIGPFVSQATFKRGKLDGVWIIYDNQMR